MRAKKPTLVITFPTTTAALGWGGPARSVACPGGSSPYP